MCEDAGFIARRRKVLRLRAGLSDKDYKLVLGLVIWKIKHFPMVKYYLLFGMFSIIDHHHEVPKFRFIILEGKRAVIAEREAISKFKPLYAFQII